MSQKKLDPSVADLLESASEAERWRKKFVDSQVDEIPKGWITREQASLYLRLNKSQTNLQLSKSIAKGDCLKKDFLIFKNGRRIRKPHYFLK